MDHSPGFLALVQETQPRVQEISIEEAKSMLTQNPEAVLLDVREDHEWNQEHALQAHHLGKGVLERDLEKKYPNPQTAILMYCGGGFRSILTCDAAQKMGYSQVFSIQGGFKSMKQAQWPMVSP